MSLNGDLRRSIFDRYHVVSEQGLSAAHDAACLPRRAERHTPSRGGAENCDNPIRAPERQPRKSLKKGSWRGDSNSGPLITNGGKGKTHPNESRKAPTGLRHGRCLFWLSWSGSAPALGQISHSLAAQPATRSGGRAGARLFTCRLASLDLPRRLTGGLSAPHMLRPLSGLLVIRRQMYSMYAVFFR